MEPPARDEPSPAMIQMSRRQIGVLAASVFVIAGCGMVYELSIATVSSYLLGNSVYQFSITIGLFMAAMGAGAFASRLIGRRALEWFIGVEIVLALLGGVSSILLFTVFPHGALYGVVMYSLIAVVGGMVGVEIPIIVRFLSEQGGVRRGVADALSLDYLGALLGCLAFPILMLPHLGLLRASFAVGLVNAGVGLVNAWAFRREVRAPGLWGGLCVLVAVLLCAGFVLDERLHRYAEDALYSGRVVLREQTPYQRIVVTVDPGTREHRLYLDGHIQFAEFDEHRYHEALVHPAMALAGRRERVLILGGGDGLAAREVFRFGGVKEVTLVDLDPVMTELAAGFRPLADLNRNSLDDPRLRVVNTDAFAYLRSTDGGYDRIIVDLPDPHNEALSKLYSVEFYRLALAGLRPGGALTVQSSSPFYTPEVYGSIGQSLEAAGFSVIPYHANVPAFGPWGFHLAVTDETPDGFGWLPDARFMTAGVFGAATVFPPDTSQEGPGVNTLFEPRLYEWYRRGVARGRPVMPE